MTPFKPSTPPAGGATYTTWGNWRDGMSAIHARYDRTMSRTLGWGLVVLSPIITLEWFVVFTTADTLGSIGAVPILHTMILLWIAYQYGYHSYRPTQP